MLNAGVVLRDPERKASPLVFMRELAPGTDRWGADVTVTSEGLWRFHVEAWADPIASWHHDAAIKIPPGQDVELMLTEGALLFERAARRIPQPPGASRPAAARTALRALVARLRDRGLPPWDRLAATEDPQITAILATLPAARAGHQVQAADRAGGPGAGAVRLLVRVLPALRRGPGRPDGPPGAGLGHAAHRGQAARGDRRHGLRRGVPAAGAPDRDHVPQGPEQHAEPGRRRSGLAVGDRVRRGRARRDPPGPGHDRRLRRVRRPGPASWAWRSPSTWRCRPRPTIRG